MLNINRLLKKSSWTGEELGRLELVNALTVFSESRKGEEPKYIVEPEQFRKMLKTLKDPEELRTYNGYLSIHKWFSVFYNQGAVQDLQSQLFIGELSHVADDVRTGEYLYSYESRLPIVVTQKEYDDLKTKSMNRELHGDDREGVAFGIFNLIELAINYYTARLQKEPEKKNPLKPLMDDLKREPVADPHITSNLKGQVDLHKWDVLASGNLPEYYPSLIGEGTSDELLEEEKAFKVEFASVVDAILADMENYFQGISKVPVEEWEYYAISWEYLYENDIYGFRYAYIDNDADVFRNRQEQLANGVAIIRPADFPGFSDGECRCIDKDTGYYKAPDLSSIRSSLWTIDRFFPEDEKYSLSSFVVQNSRRIFLNSYYFIKGYNMALELVAQKFNVDELKEFFINTDAAEQRAAQYNKAIEEAQQTILNTYHNDELLEKKLEVLEDVLQPIDTSTLTIPEWQIARAKRAMKDFSAFNGDFLVNALCIRPADDGEGV